MLSRRVQALAAIRRILAACAPCSLRICQRYWTL